MRLQTPFVLRVVCAAIVLFSVAIVRADDISGTWSGSHFAQTFTCVPIWNSNGDGQVNITQTGDSFSGTGVIKDWMNPDVGSTVGPCEFEALFTLEFVIANGIVTGSSFTADALFTDDGEEFTLPLTGSIGVNHTMTITIPVPNGDPPPAIDTLFTLTLTKGPLLTPNVVVSGFPVGMVQPVNEGTATDSLSLTNNGNSPASVTLSKSGSFFTLSTSALTVEAGETRTIDIQALAQSTAGALEGTVTCSGSGVTCAPIRVVLLSAVPPPGRPRLIAPAARIETRAPAGQNPSGAVSFTNDSSFGVSAIAISDVPWIVPQSGVITLQPGHPSAVSFTVNRSRRSDASALVGGESGKLSLRFIESTRVSAHPIQTLASTATNITTISATIVDVVQPGISTATFPPLAPGEVAYFFAGLGTLGNIVTDLLLSNISASPTTDLRLYFTSTSPGATTKLLNLTQNLAPHLAVSFPSMANNVFAAGGQSGSLQIRGTSASGVAAAAVRLAQGVAGRHSTALPMLRSDVAARIGERVILSGVEKSAGVHTNLYIQEVSGAHGTVQIDFLNASGQPLSARAADSVNGFATLELTDVVPAGAVVARINIVSDGGNARFAAYALVVDETTSDAWVVSDLIRSGTTPSGAFVVPLPSVKGSPQRDISLTNVALSTITATVDSIAPPPRRRVSAHALPMESEATQSVVLTPLQTATSSVSIVNGYLRLTAPSGTLTGSARMAVSNPPTPGQFRSGLVSVPTTAALASGQSKRFTGVDDASPATIASATAGTQRSSLILIETEGHSATLRLTMRFTFPGGAKVTGIGLTTKEITIGANRMITLSDIGNVMIGNERDAFGDLTNTQIDVEVIAGSGRVAAFLQSIDNGSGDVLMRID
ncbi:MAG: hypothetical protein M3P06_21150 [Acidobacteriota bacterium]|nr:hypothetical protein [Acidobacteriota bacterium]